MTIEGQEIFAFNAKRKTDYLCPHCKHTVRLRAGKIVKHHFYHLKGSNCKYKGESEEHLMMKQRVIDFFNEYPMRIEIQVIPYRRADVLLQVGKKCIVVECQTSPITIEEWNKRTLDYSRNGIYVLWIFHTKRLKIKNIYEFDEENEIRVPVEILHAQHYSNKVFLMDDEQNIISCKFTPVERTVYFNN